MHFCVNHYAQLYVQFKHAILTNLLFWQYVRYSLNEYSRQADPSQYTERCRVQAELWGI